MVGKNIIEREQNLSFGRSFWWAGAKCNPKSWPRLFPENRFCNVQ